MAGSTLAGYFFIPLAKLSNMKMIRPLLPAALLLAGLVSNAQKPFNPSDLMEGKMPANMIAPLPSVSWLNDETYTIAKDGKTVMVDVKTGKESPLEPQRPGQMTGNKTVTVRNNDIFLKQGAGLQEIQLTHDAAEEKNPTFSPDSNWIAYTKSNNLYSYDLTAKKEYQLTSDGTQTILNGYATWVYYEEIFGRSTHYRAFWWSPDNKTIAYMRFDENKIPMFPIYKADGTHGELEETRYPKAGDPNPDVKLGFVQAAGGNTTWTDFGEPSSHELGWPKWTPDGSGLFVQRENRGQDSLILFNVNPADGNKKQVYAETQSTWISLDDADARLTFIHQGKDIVIQSDKEGWNHLYLYTADGQFKNKITTGNIKVLQVINLDDKKDILFFTARPADHSTETHLYSVKLNGKEQKQVTVTGFNNTVTSMSPGAKYFFTTYSNLQTPRTIALIDAKGKQVREIASSKGVDFANYTPAKTELIRIKSADGKYDLPAIITWPANMQPGKKYPMLVSVYGGPDATQVMDTWNWSPSRQWYAQEGLIQVSFDNRASGHFGKFAMGEIHRQLGILEIEDFRTMAKYFIDKGYADPSKICITGFSFGGYMTCMALTYASDVFTHGMAGGSVTDWHLYDSHYTERFMDMPQENPEGYKKTSVMEYVDKYHGMLQIVHGTMDDNVHMQNSIQLIGALEDKKKDFEFMLYPNGRHGWRNLPARNSHFENLKTKFIYKYLLEKEVPADVLK